MKEKIMKLIADELGVEFGEVFKHMEYKKLIFKIEKDGVYYSRDGVSWEEDVADEYIEYKKEDIVRS